MVRFVCGSGSQEGSVLYSEPVERSEEHTSELQSRGHLVCCLLPEKKKTRTSGCTATKTRASTSPLKTGKPTASRLTVARCSAIGAKSAQAATSYSTT